MSDWTTARVTPEMLAELRRLLDANEVPWSAHRPSPNYARYEIRDDRGYDLAYTVEDALGDNAEIIVAAVNALPALLDAAAERDALAESVRAYGRTIDRWGLLIIAATHSEGITTPDGDCDWEVIESRLAEVPALLAERDALAAKVERVRALHASSGTAESQGYDAEGEYGLIAPYCTGCEASDEYATAWPCPTIRALDTTPDTGGES